MNKGMAEQESYAWSDRFNTGLPDVDEQHRKMTAMVNALVQFAKQDAPNEALLALARELFDFTVFHFAYEEKMMAEHGLDPDFASAHQRAHGSLTEQVRIVVEMLESALVPSSVALLKLLPFLHKWMIFHVVGTDMRMARMILALQRGASQDEAVRDGLMQQTESLVVLLDTLNELYDDLALRSTELEEAHYKLAKSEARYALAQRAAGIGSWEYDLKTSELSWSSEVEALFGLPAEVLQAGYSSYLQCMHPDDRDLVRQAIDAAVHGHKDYNIEHRIIRPDGSLRWVAATGDFVCAPDGAALRLVGIVRDITAQHESQLRLEETNQQLNLALGALERHATDLVRLNTLNEGLQSSLTVSDAYEVLERTLSHLQLGSGGALAISSADGSMLKQVACWGEGARLKSVFSPNECWAMRRGQRHALRMPCAGPTCKHFDVQPSGAVLCQPLLVLGENLGLLTVRAAEGLSDTEWARVNHLTSMVTESLKLALCNIRLREALHEQAIRDPLTHLFNRRYLDETLPRELHRAIREQRKISVVMIDLDHFKEVNDTWGHEAGDAILVHVAKVFQENLRASDLACRFGGEEFVLVLFGADAAEARERMQLIAEKLSDSSLQLQHRELPCTTFSAGIAEAFLHGDSAEKLLRVADHALYAAKAAGRDCTLVAPLTP